MERKVKDYIVTKENGRYGLSLKSGEIVTPCVYDEITPKDYYFLCRIWKNSDYVYFKDGSTSTARRIGGSPQGNFTTLKDLDFYNNIKPEENDGYYIVYRYGRFGLENKKRQTIIPCEYDNVFKWKKADVIQTRKKEDCRYFNLRGDEILTDRDSIANFTQYGYLNGTVQIKELVKGMNDGRTFFHDKVGYIRLFLMSPEECTKLFKCDRDVIPLPVTATNNMIEHYSYEFSGCILYFSIKSSLNREIDKLKETGFLGNSFYFTDKFFANSRTHLKATKLVELRRHYEDEERCLDNSPYIGYGIDDSLEDGVVKWLHVEHYNEHCFPGHTQIGNLVKDGQLKDLKEYVEGINWDTTHDSFGGPFFHLGSVWFTTKRIWNETEKVLEYIASYFPGYDNFLYESVCGLKTDEDEKPTVEQVKFYYRCVNWALKKGANPNYCIHYGKTILDKLNSFDYSNVSKGAVFYKEKTKEQLLRYGALSLKSMRTKETMYYKVHPYDYDELIKYAKSQGAFKIGTCTGLYISTK